jgi:transposase
MTKIAKFVGLDVHKSSISIAWCEGGARSEAVSMGKIDHDVSRLLRKLKPLGEPQDVHVAYEAGPTGYGLYRQLVALGYPCIVVAPNRTPTAPGPRVKTDRRDAASLAFNLRSGTLTAVSVPDEQTEALRDLTRYREDVREELQRARQQVVMFLLRHSRKYDGKSHWTIKHREWLRSQRFDHECQREVLEESYQEVVRLEEKLERLEAMVERAALQHEQFKPLFQALQSFRGMRVVTAATLIAELGDLRRFATAPQLMSYLGLTPREYSSGSKVSRGSITKAGNGHVRRVLVESAWHGRHRPAKTKSLLARTKGLPEDVLALSWKAQHRLHERWCRMRAAPKEINKIVIAMARELAGFVWALGQLVLPKQA